MFCDYCDCDDCKYGKSWISHAQTVDGTWICSTCYTYEICQTFEGFKGNPCDNDDCGHRPKLITGWSETEDMDEIDWDNYDKKD